MSWLKIKKNRRMKHSIIVGLSLLICITMQAKKKDKYFSITAGGGLHELSYNLQTGTQKGQFGYTFNVGYSYFFTPNWGVQLGFGIQSFNAESTLNYLSSIPAIDSDGESYVFRANYKNWKEKQGVLFFDVPLAIQYRHVITPNFGLLGSVGAKISMPVSASYKNTGGEIVTTGYYSQWNVELKNMPQHGFGTNTINYTGGLSLNPSYIGVVDLGGIYTLLPNIDLYLGGYIDYGLNNILTASDKEVFQSDGVYNGVFKSPQTSKVNPVAIGVKVGVYFKLGKVNRCGCLQLY